MRPWTSIGASYAPPNVLQNDKAKSGKVCASCGGTNHLRKSSLKRPNNVKNQPPPKKEEEENGR
eukprot:9415033-Ditylum_brightwellii.AAC.1